MTSDVPERHRFEILIHLREMSRGWDLMLVIDGEQTDYLGQLSLQEALARVESYGHEARTLGAISVFPRLIDQFGFGTETIEPAA